MDLVIDLVPVSARIAAGHRLRLALHGADRDNYHVDECSPPAEYLVHLGDGATRLVLPVVDTAVPERVVADAFRDLPAANRYATRIG